MTMSLNNCGLGNQTLQLVDRRWLKELERDMCHGRCQVVVVTEAVKHETDVDIGVIAVVRSTAQ